MKQSSFKDKTGYCIESAMSTDSALLNFIVELLKLPCEYKMTSSN